MNACDPNPIPLAELIDITALDQHRKPGCDNYGACLDMAVRENWRSFSCEKCHYTGISKPAVQTRHTDDGQAAGKPATKPAGKPATKPAGKPIARPPSASPQANAGREEEKKIMKHKKICDEDNCDEPVKARGKCVKHYNEWYSRERKESGLKLGERGMGRGGPIWDHPAPRDEADGGKPATLPADKQVKEEEAQSRVLYKLDFKNCPEMLVEVREKAKDEFRSVNAQILYLIKEGLKDA